MNERGLRRAFAPLVAFLLLTLLAAALVAYLSDFTYNREAGYEAYTAIARALAAVLGAALLGVAVILHSLRLRRERLETGLMRWLDAQGAEVMSEWGAEVEQVLGEPTEANPAEIEEALAERESILKMRRYALRLFGLPIAGFLALVSLSLWAIPATEVFLHESLPELGSTFLLLTSYGTAATLASLVAAVMVVGKE